MRVGEDSTINYGFVLMCVGWEKFLLVNDERTMRILFEYVMIQTIEDTFCLLISKFVNVHFLSITS